MKQGKSLKKDMRRCLVAAILLSAALPAGILMIVFGATGKMHALLAFGIVFAVAGFYGAPMVWIKFSSYFTLKAIAGAVEDGLYDAERIAETLGKQAKEVKNQISYLISRRYLAGYSFDGERLTAVTPQKRMEKVGKCAGCGGNLTATEQGAICPYCGAEFIER